ncbi:MAG: enoyl-CoA hydratase-related protein [Rhodobacteraceae bacterium]|jgi:2-(1,2-epoxy-1,2-dihydrophenyl)acetyl-CoA isomerase|nr:enoyl-CoA hydratase-related protein [Paracoccaceae bacterium]
MDDPILVTDDGALRVITLNRPAVMNALNAPLRRALTAAIAAPGARCIVLTGAGRAFCAGQDLTEAGAVDDIGGTLAREYEPLLAAITDAPVPVVAAVNGVAAGAGANLALVCDLVIAAESATFVQAFARIGLVPDAGGTWVLPRLVGQARAMGAMLTGDAIPARQAADWGMIWDAVPDADFPAHWQTRAAALAQGPTAAYAQMKTLVRLSATNDLPAQLLAEARAQAACGATDDFREGVAAFAARRPPRFIGR